MTTVQAIISLVASKGWKLWQLDVTNAFLYGELDPDIFMEQPQGFIYKEYPDYVWRLKNALYGLKQALYACADPSLFIKKTPTKKTSPMELNIKLFRNEEKPLENATLFRQLVGSLFYLTITRFNIAFSVGVISQFMEIHLIAAKRILYYIKGTLSYRLMYAQSKPFSLSGFIDVDWAGDENDRCSTTSFYFTTGSAAISWCSTTVALSSCKAENVAATMATQ
ncbi:Retrovirus-related Pol polyprotein from transposon TNT 1-94 [Gossypium australe]|uniref:Retrovirus-related Pol polyprotein from transposon TNT 1-94 n=1 Tax=Gossypium australe TaxID=47621 RepID=A0A5B6UTR2_9ROSI|nr:Retrovirus-related Pol polyprotein from transposon TNT 1-94 [Gossypium australe]